MPPHTSAGKTLAFKVAYTTRCSTDSRLLVNVCLVAHIQVLLEDAGLNGLLLVFILQAVCGDIRTLQQYSELTLWALQILSGAVKVSNWGATWWRGSRHASNN
eukprot:GHRR01017332.1.p2 GENE.GHRR01017332.1~~GHRR01017332.1.p2  ORF type:complete len:103 (-),score=22.55 GHRR01017332.1:2021-2329(-)